MKHNNFKNFLLFIFLMFTTFMFSACIENPLISLSNKAIFEGLFINRIIYTDDASKYADENKLYISEDDLNNNYDVKTVGISVYLCDYNTSDLNKLQNVGDLRVDLIIDTNKLPISYSVYNGVNSMKKNSEEVLIDNSHIFAGKTFFYRSLNGEFIHSNPLCDPNSVCDDWDGCMCEGEICRKTDNFIISENQLSDSEISSQLGASEWMVEETPDGYVYTELKPRYGHCEPIYVVDTPAYLKSYEVPLLVYFPFSFKMVADFNELIIDGYDFSYLDNFLKEFDYTNYKVKNYCDFTDFGYMFSDLPVEKITINNVTGLGENVKSLKGMFENCTNLKTVEFGNFFDNIKPTNLDRMFYNCPKLENINLSGLDSSKVESMSYMFGQDCKLTFEKREELITDYINTYNSMGYLEKLGISLDPSINYTLDSMAQHIGVDKNMLLVNICEMTGLPISYNELCLGTFGRNLSELIDISSFENIEDFLSTIYQTIAYGKGAAFQMFKCKNLNVVPEATLQIYNKYEHPTREQYFNEYLDLLIKTLGDTSETTWTVDTLAETLNVSPLNIMYSFNILSNLIPLTYDEFTQIKVGMSYDEFLIQLNSNPSELEIPILNMSNAYYTIKSQGEGNPYTDAEGKILLRQIAAESDLALITDEELILYNTPQEPIQEPESGVLTLGGQNSKFVLNENVIGFNILENNTNFGTITTPQIKSQQIKVTFGNTYTNARTFTTNELNYQSHNLELYYYIEGYNDPYLPQDPIVPPDGSVELPPQGEEPEDDGDQNEDETPQDEKLNTTSILIFASVVLVVSSVIGFVVIKLSMRRSKQ